jgi:GTP-binding protein LepA
MIEQHHTRNFCIIAHIDHGKSTLADRMLELTHTVEDRLMREQLLDNMDLERERGITIKSHPVTMRYESDAGGTYEFNLIDTPGHVDFTYEVSRSMAACEGAILVVDAAQGVEAQTVANAYLAMERDLTIIPVLNKVDLPNADPDGVAKQIEDILGIDTGAGLRISAKTGSGVRAVMEAVIRLVPPPSGNSDPHVSPRALVFDSIYDAFRGVITYVRVMDGQLRVGDAVRLMSTGATTQLKEVGIFSPKQVPRKVLHSGQVGYLIGTLKTPADIQVGDTVTSSKEPASDPLPGFSPIKSMVFSGLYPVDTADYEKCKQGLDKLSLNDAAFTYHSENSTALGFGFRCGFLGLLHMEVIQERLRREFDLDIISTHPGVVYRVYTRDGKMLELDNPVHLPDPSRVEKIEEPLINAFIICRNEHIGELLRLIMERRGEVTRTESIDTARVMLTCTLPLNEILTDFHDNLKSATKGYASMDYEHSGFQVSPIVKLEILLNSEPVDAFATLVHRDKAVERGRQICKALADAIPPHMFTIPVQATLGRTVIARETIRAFRKDVTAKLYGGDVTRKRKLLEKQKKGKKRMKQFGKVSVPQSAFISVLKNNTN